MSSAFNPPKTLSQDDIRRVADVRRAVWTAGLQGGAAGIFAASSAWYALRRTGRLPVAWRSPNHWMLATFGAGALASFLCSLAAGKNSVQRIGDIFRRGAHEWRTDPPELSSYQRISIENQKALDDSRIEQRREALARWHRASTADGTAVGSASSSSSGRFGS
mmetsp:Transcript_15745/g.49288  ORF Transcript_15745/g.49288 Transcript_15745/m.49288 type:complete len:163 (+) Transcript_15745:219-707(+)